ncbi:hypothetical protein [Streptomyces sp. NRRL F-5755]|uniref:hypothetical protein n=1 Tax=Streptomyces sp. NRRL F-5755 TaxID=1519475 RepID=UPI0006B05892|nr:hypothetical protein [Streptomyces sp. NRRL F-5755]
MPKRSPVAERRAELIRTALLGVAPGGMTLMRLAGACELSRWQTRRALAALKDICAQNHWPTLTWTRDLGYHFCGNEDELELWEQAWLDAKLVQFGRALTSVIGPHLELFPQSLWAIYLKDQVRAVESALALAAEQLAARRRR